MADLKQSLLAMLADPQLSKPLFCPRCGIDLLENPDISLKFSGGHDFLELRCDCEWRLTIRDRGARLQDAYSLRQTLNTLVNGFGS